MTLLSLLLCCQFAVTVDPSVSPFTVEVATQQQEQQSEYYVCVFTARWCGPCRRFQESPRFAKIREAYPVRLIDVDEDPNWTRVVPAVWLCRRTELGRGVVVHKFVGSVTVDELRARE